MPFLRQRQFDVHAVVSSSAPPDNTEGVTWHRCDLLDSEQLTSLMKEVSPELLLHLAWFTRPGEYWTSDKNLDGVRASLELAEAFAANGGSRAVLAGSCAEYDWRYGYCSESVTPMAPSTLYGTCKHSLNLMTSAFFEKHNISNAWGRIFYVYGPNEHKDRLVPSVARALLQGEPAFCSSGQQVRDFLYVQDVAAAFVALLQSEVQGNVNIASGTPKSVRDLAFSVAAEIGRPDLIRLCAREETRNEAPLVVAHVERLKNDVGFEPSYKLSEGIRRCIDWWRNRDRIPEFMDNSPDLLAAESRFAPTIT